VEYVRRTTSDWRPPVKHYSVIFDAFRSIASPSSRELAELILWGLLAVISLALVFLPGDQTLQGLEWLFRSVE
jgi:hypothetical protein